jgi:hypothetical protein
LRYTVRLSLIDNQPLISTEQQRHANKGFIKLPLVYVMSWEIKDKSENTNAAETIIDAILVLPCLIEHEHDYTYTVENESGDEKTVVARDEEELGEKISNGDFEPEKEPYSLF